MTQLLETINQANTSELYQIVNDLKRYAVSRDITNDDRKRAVDAIIEASKRIDPYDRTSVHATYQAYGVKVG